MLALTSVLSLLLLGTLTGASPVPASNESGNHLQKRLGGYAYLHAGDGVKVNANGCGACFATGGDTEQGCNVPKDCDFFIDGNKCHLAGIFTEAFRSNGVSFDLYGGSQFIQPCNSGGVTIVGDRMPVC